MCEFVMLKNVARVKSNQVYELIVVHRASGHTFKFMREYLNGYMIAGWYI